MLSMILAVAMTAPVPQSPVAKIETCVWPNTCVQVAKVQPCVWPNFCVETPRITSPCPAPFVCAQG